ncbi:ABC transporter substrate-binding protein [Pigmentiphaga sp.]|uniref:ABC transporter substrate-binding protein n=1 Tax=Pigmentiphaga sp. TaxID=1977564 RepID=UPI00343B4983
MPMKTLKAAALAFAAACLLPAAAAQPPIKIGFLGEFSGPQAGLGQDMYDGFMLGIKQGGGRLGGVPVEVLREDTQLKPDVAVQVTRKLIEREKVPIIAGITFSNIMMSVQPLATRREVFVIGTNAGPSPIAGEKCSPYQFVVSRQGDQQAEVLGKYATQKGYRRVMLLAPNYQAGKDVLAGFRRYFKNEVVDEIYTPLDQFDFSAELARVSAQKPDAVFAFYPGSPGVNFVRQYRQLGLADSTPLMSVAVVDGVSLPALREAALGVLLGSTWGPDLATEANRKFVAAFEAAYGRTPSEYAATSYDAARLLDSAIGVVKGNVADKPAFMAALKAARFESIRGDFKFGHNHFPIQDLHVFQVARDEKGRIGLKTVETPMKATQDAYHSGCTMR